MKKTILLSLLFFAVLVLQSNLFASTKNIKEVINQANDEILAEYGAIGLVGNEGYYFDENQVSKDVYNSYKSLVYNKPHGNQKNSEYRYLGYAPSGEIYPNYKYPYDVNSGDYFDYKVWIDNPWDDVRVTTNYPTVYKNDFDYNSAEYKDNFILGMIEQHGPRFENNPTIPWENYYHIVVPPTRYSYGVA